MILKQHFKTHKINKNTVHNSFERIFYEFHRVTGQRKVYKALCKRLWDKTISLESKKQAYNNINKNITVKCYNYLLKQFGYAN